MRVNWKKKRKWEDRLCIIQWILCILALFVVVWIVLP